MKERIRKGLAILLATSMVITGMTVIGSNRLLAADVEAADQVEQIATIEEIDAAEAEVVKVENPTTVTQYCEIDEGSSELIDDNQMEPADQSAALASTDDSELASSDKIKVTVTITGNSKSVTYNGREQSVTGYTVSISEGGESDTEDAELFGNIQYTEDDFIFEGEAEASRTVAGTTAMNLEAAQFANINDDFEVKFVIVDGSITVNPRHIVLKSASASKTYDGKPLTRDIIQVGGDGFISGEGFIFKFTGSQTKVGSSSNTFKYSALDDAQAENFAKNYTIETVYGTLTVTKAQGGVTDTSSTSGNSGNTGGTSDRAVNKYVVTESGESEITVAEAGTQIMEIADGKTPLGNVGETEDNQSSGYMNYMLYFALVLGAFLIGIVVICNRRKKI